MSWLANSVESQIAGKTLPEAHAIMMDAARQLYLAGVQVSVERWLDLSMPERAALVGARKMVRMRELMQQAMLLRGGRDAAAAYGEIDGYEAHDEMVMDELTDAVADLFLT